MKIDTVYIVKAVNFDISNTKMSSILTRAGPRVVVKHYPSGFSQICAAVLAHFFIHPFLSDHGKFQTQVTPSDLTSEKFKCSSQLHRMADHLETFSG